MQYDLIVLGGGPAGLGAALAAVRAGAHVALLDAADQVGGMSTTTRRDDFAYDSGGHILFVHDGAREAWLRELLGADLTWVDRPVASIDDAGIVVPGRYLDRRVDGLGAPPPLAQGCASAAELLNRAFGPVLVDREFRRYLEKVDGMALERILAARAQKLLTEQYAPNGFWYPAAGVGQLMDAMARAIVAGGGEVLTRMMIESIGHTGGRVESVSALGLDGRPRTMSTRTIVAGLPPATAARLAFPHETPVPLPPRAAIIVALALDVERVSEHAWIQIDRSDVPFARLAEMKYWSPRLAPPERTVVVCEVYCDPTPDDPWWSLTDEALARVCAAALMHPLALVDPSTQVATLEVARIARAWSLVDVAAAEGAATPSRWLSQLDGFVGAQGGDVVSAIAAGEFATATALAARR